MVALLGPQLITCRNRGGSDILAPDMLKLKSGRALKGLGSFFASYWVFWAFALVVGVLAGTYFGRQLPKVYTAKAAYHVGKMTLELTPSYLGVPIEQPEELEQNLNPTLSVTAKIDRWTSPHRYLMLLSSVAGTEAEATQNLKAALAEIQARHDRRLAHLRSSVESEIASNRSMQERISALPTKRSQELYDLIQLEYRERNLVRGLEDPHTLPSEMVGQIVVMKPANPSRWISIFALTVGAALCAALGTALLWELLRRDFRWSRTTVAQT